MKFGGTSMGSADSIKNVANIIKVQLAKEPVAVVVSAVSGTTDKLIALANTAVSKEDNLQEKLEDIKQTHFQIIAKLGIENNTQKLFETLEDFIMGIKLIKELSPHSYDFISSYGERISATILAQYLNKIGIRSDAIMADSFLVTTEVPGSADPIIEQSKLNIPNGVTPIITGFLGRSTDNKITTLGRGGSDYSAAAVGAILNANEIQIWTDVSGLYTTDPRICQLATPHTLVSFREASELAKFGAKVLHPRTMLPAKEEGIPIIIKNTFHPEKGGTKITFNEEEVPKTVKAVAIKKDIQLITICSTEMLMTCGFMAKIFNTFAKHNISVDIVATSEITVSISVEDKATPELIQDLKTLGTVTVEDTLNIIAVVGSGLENDLMPNAQILKALAENNIDAKVLTQGSTQINFSIIVEEKNAVEATQIIHKTLFE
jgi:aspartate kinase